MIEHVLGNLGHENSFTLCVLRDQINAAPDLFDRLASDVTSLTIVPVDTITRGAAETCLFAKQHIQPDKPLMIANCDQLMRWDQPAFEAWLAAERLDGAIFVFRSDSLHNSYVEIDSSGVAVRTAEKQVISPYATTGIYVWTRGRDFVWAAETMIAKNVRVNNEFYVCPCYNENILRGDRIGIWWPEEHWPIGTPRDLELYVEKRQ